VKLLDTNNWELPGKDQRRKQVKLLDTDNSNHRNKACGQITELDLLGEQSKHAPSSLCAEKEG
jgi:hypothetical protein